MSERMDGKVVVVTGASAGVGRAIAHAFGKRGATVALLARGERGLDDCAAEVEALGGNALVLPTDVADAGGGGGRGSRGRGALRRASTSG